MATLRLHNVKKTYDGTTPIIHGIHIDIQDGEMIVIVGPSGCGKSSLLRMIAGLEEVTEGDIYINNRQVDQLEPKDQQYCHGFSNDALYPHMTVYQNMAYALRMRGIGKAGIAKRVQRTAEILELTDLLTRTPQELSGGQRQRVAMGRALIRQPDIFLFDEPLSNLDAKLRVQMRLEIKKLQRELKTTSVYVTHDQVEAMTMAHRLVLMNEGRVEQIGTPLEIYEKPASTFAAGFLGSPAMNFIKAKLSAKGDAVILSPNIVWPLHTNHYMHCGGLPVIVGVRPESIVQAAPDTQADPLPLSIEMVEALGADTLAYGFLPEVKQRITVRLSGQWRPELNEVVHLSVMPQSIHIFDATTGVRL